MIQDTKECIESKLLEMRVDGGMTGNELLMQFQSDILNTDIIRPTITETTALGAAYVAGLAIGIWENVDELRNNWAEDKRFIPEMKETKREELYTFWGKAVQRSLNWVE